MNIIYGPTNTGRVHTGGLVAISDAVEGEVGRVLSITWRQQGTTTPETLTGGTITGKIRAGPGPDYADTAIAGTLTVTDGANGIFTWTLAAGDTDTPGLYQVQFQAVVSSKTLKTFFSPWAVHDAA
jgi:hypothetical protein